MMITLGTTGSNGATERGLNPGRYPPQLKLYRGIRPR